VPISSHIRRLRDMVGSELLLLPSAAVIPRDEQGRVLLVRVVDTGQWAAIGGSMELDETPRDGARREAEEEAGITVHLRRILAVLGGPEYRMVYPNGDETAYVTTVFDATVLSGTPRPDGDETSEVAWFALDDLPVDEMSAFTRALLRDVGLLPSPPGGASANPILVLVTGLPGTGKSTVADHAAELLGCQVLAHDWAMSGLRPFPELQQALDRMAPVGHRKVGWSVLGAMARSQLRRRSSVVLDGVARMTEIEQLQEVAAEENAVFVTILCECSDPNLHRSRIEGRRRGIPGWYELAWDDVERARRAWDAELPADLRIDAAQPLDSSSEYIARHLRRAMGGAADPSF
jgi:ADP-ribose pyrophosphatase YjhB (NUDIX family)/predicted kinase